MFINPLHEYSCVEIKAGPSALKCLGLSKTLGHKEDQTPCGGSEAMAGSRGHRHGLEEVYGDQCFFSTPIMLQAWLSLTLCYFLQI